MKIKKNTMIAFKEYILRRLSSSSLFEMAFDRHDLQKRVESLAKQIVENWVMIRYIRLCDKNGSNINHWCNELLAHLDNIQSMYYKGDKRAVIEDSLINKMELVRRNNILNLIRVKCRKEGIDINDKMLLKACDDFCEDLMVIITLISLNDSDALIEYIEKF